MKVLVTGGASGIGGAVTRRLAAAGHTVCFTFCASAERAAEIERAHEGTRGLRCDFRDEASVGSLLDEMPSLHLDALVNNAMTGLRQAHFHKADAGDLRDGFAHNVLPVVRITQRAIALFRKARAGRIVTVLTSSLVGRPPLGLSAYVAEKAYLASLVKSWAVENAAFGISSTAISPSLVRTGLAASFDERTVEAMIEAHPLKRLVTEDEVAQAIEGLLTGSPHLSGAHLVMNAAQDVL